MVRHVDPGKQPAPPVVVEEKRPFEFFGYVEAPEHTGAPAFVEICLQLGLFLALILDAQQVFPFSSSRRGQGICQSPSQELLCARRVKMR